MDWKQPVAILKNLDDGLFQEVRQLLAEETGLNPEQIPSVEINAYLERLLAETLDEAQSIHSLFEQQVERSPDATALIADGKRITYQALNQRSNQVAHMLRQLGVAPDMLVGMCAERSIEIVIGILGILKADAAYVPLDPSYPTERLAYMLQDTAVPILLTQEHLLEQLPEHTAQTICLDRDWPTIARNSAENPTSGVSAANLAYVIYTSGSTNHPKGVMLSHESLRHNVCAMHTAVGVTSSDVYLHTATFGFSSSVRQLMLPLCHGATVMIATLDQIRNPIALMELVQQQGVTIMDLTPSSWRNCVYSLTHLKTRTRQALLDNRLRLLLSASEPLLSDVPKSWAEQLGHPAALINMFGQTETTGIVSTYPIPKKFPEQIRVTAIGKPITNTRIYLLDEYGELVPPDLPGYVHIGGPGLGRGYLNQAAMTAERFVPDPFSTEPGERLYKTGDLARYTPDGNLEFLGRADFQVKIRGVRIELGEIEGNLRQHPAVHDALALVQEDSPGDKRLIAYLVPDPSQAPTISDLRQFLKGKLPDYMMPSNFVLMEKLPLTTSGKIDRRALPRITTTRPILEKVFVTPRNPIEKQLATIWADVLRLEQIGVDDHFFDLGGDSILAIQVIAKANQAGIPVTPRQLFEHTTIAKLAAVAGTAPAVLTEQGVITGPVTLMPSQHWFFELDIPVRHHFNQTYLFETRQTLAPALVEQAVREVVSHHDALRLRFVSNEDGWQQFNVGLDGPSHFSWFDLSGLSETEQIPSMEAKAAELQTKLDLSLGPLFHVTLFFLGETKPSRLLVMAHHLVMDGVSRRIVLEDLYRACQQSIHGQTIQLSPKTTSFQQWANRISEYANSPDLQQEVSHWLAEPQVDLQPLPRDYPDGEYSLASSGVVTVSLTPEETINILQKVPQAYQTQINDVLLTALLNTFSSWTGSQSLQVDLVGHGREPIFDDIDLSRTVGWCSATFPVVLQQNGDGPGAILKAVHGQLERVPKYGIGYGALRYLGNDVEIKARLQAMPQPEIVFSYTGQIDQTLAESPLFSLAHESTGPAQDPRGTWPYLFDVYAQIIHGQLNVNWLYSTNIYRRATVEKLAQGFCEALRAILASIDEKQ